MMMSFAFLVHVNKIINIFFYKTKTTAEPSKSVKYEFVRKISSKTAPIG